MDSVARNTSDAAIAKEIAANHASQEADHQIACEKERREAS